MERISADTRVLAVLPDLIDGLSRQASPSTVRQRLWAINQAVEHYAATHAARTDINTLTRVRLGDILEPSAVSAYLADASTGDLRIRTPSPERKLPESSRTTAARAAALRWLAAHTQTTPPPATPQDRTLTNPSARLAEHLRYAVTAWSDTDRPTLVRAAAAAVTIAATAATTAELATMTISDVDNQPGLTTLPARTLKPLPGTFTDLDGQWSRAQLHPWALAPFRAWLRHRQQIVAELEGSDPGHLFVTCHPNRLHAPPGMPLSVRGLTAAHTTAVRRLAQQDPGITPPATLALLRRVALANLLGPA